MSNILRVLLAAFACVALNATSFAGGPFGIIHVGKWEGAAYTTDKGAFSFCIAAAKFPNVGGLLIIGNADRSWLIGIDSSDLASSSAPSLPLVLTFNGQAQFEISPRPARDKVLVGRLPNQGDRRPAARWTLLADTGRSRGAAIM